jgi:hypothetical protein
MNRTFYKVLGGSLLIALIFVGFGCRKAAPKPVAPKPQAPAAQQQAQPPAAPTEPAAPAVETPSAFEEPSAVEESAIAGNCNHPYYPLKNGNEIDYRVTSGGQTTDYVLKVSDVTYSSAKLNISFTKPSPMTIVQSLQCLDGTIRTDGYLDMGAAMSGGTLKTETKSVSGDLMPKNLEVGTTWTTKYDTLITMQGANLPPGIGKMSGAVESVNKVEKEESVTVPAGTYQALKVRVDTTATVIITGLPTGPTTTKQTNYQWWVKGVGMVKMSDAEGNSPTEAIMVIIK